MSQDRPRLPAPHQIVAEIDKTVFETPPSSKRSLVYHGAVTLEATLLGFAIGSALGILLAVLDRPRGSLDKSLMPWIVASQTMPIIALAPMIVVILNQFDVTGIVPKADDLRLSVLLPGHGRHGEGPALARPAAARPDADLFGLRAPDLLQAARCRRAVPFLFASLKVAVAASLVGAVVAEVTKSEDGGLGARLARRLLLRADDPDLGGAVRRRRLRRVLVGLVGHDRPRSCRKRMGYAR